MIGYILYGERKKKETPVVNSIRDQLMCFLRDGQDKRFSEIAKHLSKKDNVVSRELKELIAREWVTKTGKGLAIRYRLDIEREYVKKYFKIRDALPSPEDFYYDYKFDIEPVKAYLKLDDSKLYSIESGVIVDRISPKITRAIASMVLPNIKITVACEKIENLEEDIKAWLPCCDINDIDTMSINYEEFKKISAFAELMFDIATKRADRKVQNFRDAKKKEMPEEEFKKMSINKDSDYYKESLKIYLETFNQEFKVILTWRPVKKLGLKEAENLMS